MHNKMFEHAKCLVTKFGFTGGYGITSYGFDVMPGQLIEGQQFTLEGGSWSIEYMGGARFVVKSLSTFQQCKELMPGLYSRAFDAEVVPGVDSWVVSLFNRQCCELSRAEIKAKWHCVDCGDRIILVDDTTVVGYIYRHIATQETWSSLVTYLCEGRAHLPTMSLCYGPKYITMEAQDIGKQFDCVLQEDSVLLVERGKVVGTLGGRVLTSGVTWAALKHYLVEMK